MPFLLPPIFSLAFPLWSSRALVLEDVNVNGESSKPSFHFLYCRFEGLKDHVTIGEVAEGSSGGREGRDMVVLLQL